MTEQIEFHTCEHISKLDYFQQSVLNNIRLEDGKFGDQKYLDDWPERFSELVHVLKDKEKTLAPWNVNRFPYSGAIFYHFHGLRIISKNKIHIGNYNIPSKVFANIYEPYFKDITEVIKLMEKNGYEVKAQIKFKRNYNLIEFFKSIYRGIKRKNFKGQLSW